MKSFLITAVLLALTSCSSHRVVVRKDTCESINEKFSDCEVVE